MKRKFENLNKQVLNCINDGFDDLKLVEVEDVDITNEARERYLANKLRTLANMIEKGLISTY